MFLIWLGIIITLMFIELTTLNLKTICFVGSALISLLISFFINNFVIQFLVFIILGIVFLLTLRDTLIQFLRKKEQKTDIDKVIGKKAIVTREIKTNFKGEVKINGKYWTAYSTKKIKVGKSVKVLSVDGIKLKVEEVKK